METKPETITLGHLWETDNPYLGLCLTDGENYFNHLGEQLRDPSEYDPNQEGYTPFGDE